MFLIVLFCFIILSSCSTNKESSLLRGVVTEGSIQQKRVFLQDVKGVIISGDGQMPPHYVIDRVVGVQFYRSMRFLSSGKKKKFQRQLEGLVMGQTLTYENLDEIKQMFTEFYYSYGKKEIQVNVIDYEISKGVLVIIVPY